MNNTELLVLVCNTLPLTSQIENVDITTSDSAIRFDWRGSRFRVSSRLCVEEVVGKFLQGTNAALILEAALKQRRG